MAYRFSAPRPLVPAVPVQTLLGQVLGITALGMALTALSAYLFEATIPIGSPIALIALLGGFGLLIAINATRANEPLSLSLFYAFAFLEGIGISPIIGRYVQGFGPSIVVNAAATTAMGMFVLGAVVYATGLDLRRFQGIMMLALLGLIVAGVLSIWLHFISPTIYSWATLAIFSVLTLIDFARIRAGGDGLTPVQMATQIYLDAINIFLAILQILGNQRRRD